MSETANLGRQWQAMRARKSTLVTHVPTIFALFSLALALIMFGADTTMFSLIASAIVLSSTAICAAIYSEMRLTFLILLMFVCWCVFTVASFVWGYTTGNEEHYLMSLAAIAIFWMGQYAGITSRGLNFAWRGFLSLGLIFSIFAFFQHVYTPNHIFGIDKPYHLNRLTGTFLSSNTAATFLGIIVIAATAQIYRTWRVSYSKDHDSEAKVFLDMLQNSVLSATTFLFAFVALLLTASRAGIAVTLCAGFLFFLWVLSQILFQKNTFGNVRFGPALLTTVAIVAIFFMFWQMSGGQVEQRYETVFADVSDRANMWKASWNSYLYKPLFGHGLGSLNEAKLIGSDSLTNGSVMAQNASHNFVAQNLVQVGVIGLASMAVLYLAVIGRILRGIFDRQRYMTYLTAILLISLLVCAHGLFDYALEIPAVMLTHMWLLGLGYGTRLKMTGG